MNSSALFQPQGTEVIPLPRMCSPPDPGAFIILTRPRLTLCPSCLCGDWEKAQTLTVSHRLKVSSSNNCNTTHPAPHHRPCLASTPRDVPRPKYWSRVQFLGQSRAV